ncbi:MAG: hypothetical protein ACJ74O_06605 [Frankiaceae bacterium]
MPELSGQDPSSSALGDVYIFNATPNALLLIINNQPMYGRLAGILSSSGYAPNSIAVSRNSSPSNPGNNTFGGQNTLVVYVTGGGAQSYPVNIPTSEAQLGHDLQLYVFYNEVVLVLPSGSATDPFGSARVIGGTRISEEDISALAADQLRW